MKKMSVFYFNEFLNDALMESQIYDVIVQLRDLHQDVQSLEFISIPVTLPEEDDKLASNLLDTSVIQHLRKLGVAGMSQRYAVVMPRTVFRDGLNILLAFAEAGGKLPFVIQPWEIDRATREVSRAAWIRVMDQESAMRMLFDPMGRIGDLHKGNDAAAGSEVDSAAIGALLTSLTNRADAELFATPENELGKFWGFKWDHAASPEWNLYRFTSSIEAFKSRCRRWEEHHNGSSCVVERVRDKYLMPRIKEIMNNLATASVPG